MAEDTITEQKELTVKELVHLIEEIHHKLDNGLGPVIVLNSAFQGTGFEKPGDLFEAEIAIRDMVCTIAEALSEAHDLTHQVEW